jgi:uncharacterized protein YndB with AHSA1/START domain
MQTITVERTIAAPIERVFDWCATTTNWQSSKWVLRNKLVKPGRAAPYGVGAIRLHTWLVGRFYERITSYDPPHSYHYVVDRGLPPSRHDGGSMTFTEVPGGTDVTWSTRVEVAVPIGADLATRWIAKPMLTHVFGRILNSCARDLAG